MSDEELERIANLCRHNPKSAEEYVAWKHAFSQEADKILQAINELLELRKAADDAANLADQGSKATSGQLSVRSA